MGSTLTVQNIQGPTSGANANKIIIPSGHTLDASAGTMVPSAGQIVQVVTATTETRQSISGTTFADVLSLNITPKSATNKILLTCQFNGGSSGRYGAVKLFRGATQIAASTTSVSSRTPVWFSIFGNQAVWPNSFEYTQVPHYGEYLDSPSTTSQITYKIQAGNTHNTGFVVVVNGMTYNDEDDAWNHRTITSLTATEIAG